jgi:hypothetical protein
MQHNISEDDVPLIANESTNMTNSKSMVVVAAVLLAPDTSVAFFSGQNVATRTLQLSSHRRMTTTSISAIGGPYLQKQPQPLGLSAVLLCFHQQRRLPSRKRATGRYGQLYQWLPSIDVGQFITKLDSEFMLLISQLIGMYYAHVPIRMSVVAVHQSDEKKRGLVVYAPVAPYVRDSAFHSWTS